MEVTETSPCSSLSHLVAPCHNVISDSYQFKPPENCCNASSSGSTDLNCSFGSAGLGQEAAYLAQRVVDKEA